MESFKRGAGNAGITEKQPSLPRRFSLAFEMDEENFLQAFELVERDFSGGLDC